MCERAPALQERVWPGSKHPLKHSLISWISPMLPFLPLILLLNYLSSPGNGRIYIIFI